MTTSCRRGSRLLRDAKRLVEVEVRPLFVVGVAMVVAVAQNVRRLVRRRLELRNLPPALPCLQCAPSRGRCPG